LEFKHIRAEIDSAPTFNRPSAEFKCEFFYINPAIKYLIAGNKAISEKNIPGWAEFSFVFKAGVFVHSGSMCGNIQRRIRVKRQAG